MNKNYKGVECDKCEYKEKCEFENNTPSCINCRYIHEDPYGRCKACEGISVTGRCYFESREEPAKEHYIPSCYECKHLIEGDRNYPCNDCRGLGVSENNHFKPIEVSEKNKDSNKDRHMEICKGLNEIYEKKNKDYGDSFSVTYKEYGATMSAIRLEDKLSRFKRLIKAENEVKDESIRDTLLDLANYSIMTIMEMDK